MEGKPIFKEKYKVKTFLINDANAAALGEHRFGAGKGVNNLILITIGTGIGGGIILNGKLYAGSSGAGALSDETVQGAILYAPRVLCGECLPMTTGLPGVL